MKLAVYQYLVEQGFSVAAMAMQEACPSDKDLFVEATEEASGQLLKMLDDLTTLRQSMAASEAEKPKASSVGVPPDGVFCAYELAALDVILPSLHLHHVFFCFKETGIHMCVHVCVCVHVCACVCVHVCVCMCVCVCEQVTAA